VSEAEHTVERVLDALDEDGIVSLALELGNIDSPAGAESDAAEFVFDWMHRAGFNPRRVGILPGRFNVVGRLPGIGKGPSLLFNSHLDTSVARGEVWSTRHADHPIYHTAWRDGDLCYGNGLCNDKGQMACWMAACKAIRDTVGPLSGDLVLTSVCGEIELEPVDEFEAPDYISRELGTRYAISRGAIADFAVVAEATDFRLGWVEAGNLFFKVSVFGAEPPLYNPFVDRNAGDQSPNAIVLLSQVIPRIEDWASEYERNYRYECPGGIVVPRVNIGAIRGGLPYKISKTTQNAALYLDVRITPVQNPLDVQAELRDVLAACHIPFELELYTYRPGHEARGVEPLVNRIGKAHLAEFGHPVETALPTTTSLWRDLNAFAEARVPCVMYGPGPNVGTGNFSMRTQDLVRAARMYARLALAITTETKRERNG
jgi:acetylornithine deacetylase/succinyl-diaminopimelate desuccinylase-like protein